MVLLCSPVAKYRFVVCLLPFIFYQKLFQKPHELIFKISLRASVWCFFFPLIHSSREPRGNVKAFLFSGWHPHDVCHPAPWNPPRGELPAAPSHDVCVCVCVCKIVKGLMNQSTLLLVNTKHSPDPVTQCVSPFSPSQVDDLGWKFNFQLSWKCCFLLFFLSRGSMNSIQQNKHVRVELNPLNTCSVWIIQALYEPQSSAVCCVVVPSLAFPCFSYLWRERHFSKIKRERLLVSFFLFFLGLSTLTH